MHKQCDRSVVEKLVVVFFFLLLFVIVVFIIIPLVWKVELASEWCCFLIVRSRCLLFCCMVTKVVILTAKSEDCD